jgi:hypothetical protein
MSGETRDSPHRLTCSALPLWQLLRCAVSWQAFGQSPWVARWGAPDDALSLLFGAPLDHEANAEISTRSSPRIFTLDGHGEVRKEAALSASLKSIERLSF